MFIVFPRLRMRISVFALPLFLLMLWLEGAKPFALVILSALAHELGHIFAMKALGYNIRRLDILPMGALIVCPEGIPYRDDGIIALAGPFVSLACALGFWLCFFINGWEYALYGGVINLTLGLFNLMPIRKLDGGKALYCFLANKKAEVEKYCALASAFGFILFSFFLLCCIYASGYNLGVILLSVTLIFQILGK